MKLIGPLSALVTVLCFSSSANAEGNCPSGSYPIGGGNAGWTGCAPIPGHPNGTGQRGQQQAPIPPTPIWEDRWGAVAFDGPRGILGVATGHQNEHAAQQAALNDCQTRGGIKCQSEISYVNACTAFTIGDQGYYRGAKARLDQVIAEGMQKCKETDQNCETYYSACSLPVRIR